MIAFLLRRIGQGLLVMVAVGMMAFALFRFVGDPVNQLVGPDASEEDRERIRVEIGLKDPVALQFSRYIWRAAHLDFGFSYQFKQPVTKLIAERLPATMELAFVAVSIALVLGVLLGVYTGLHRDSFLSNVFLTVSLIGISLPTFLIGILLIFLFAVQLKVMPSFGRGQVVDLGFWTTGFLTASGRSALVLPAITLGLFQMTLTMRLVRSEMLEIMRLDFIKFARARGLKNRAIHFGHAFKNTLIPVITVTGLQFGTTIAFAIITETVFQWPGMGNLFLRAVQTVDIPIMACYLMMIGFLFVLINFIVDILYFVVDPRLRHVTKVAL
ncbi:ABC transporter permease [Candidatus Raskinella chloraquaticus]|uniref:ABC transporter permease n=1 Tax=Candidatus Raskinella chloraquaticus TaxID=1951219 RepID=A0A1W9HPR3_9HYPH|nr:ABC transporter permease [Hyphomicrobiales bacterium]OQW49455.1 MAG: ABC transporter permease [Proteobacteria bacterium SG_bin8]OQW83973.1 MAG: ABC transporter permease [Proteobacteria bacterium ST_bin15]